jgi:GrpB-like predicted nucleotidyltransferase (UPF0157 family)
MLGVEPGTVAIAGYADEWAVLFEQEKQRLQKAIGAHALAIEHVGSTSVPGLAAKPIIDIAVAVASLDKVNDCVAPLAELGYNYKGEYGLAGRHYFNKGNPRTHHLHMVLPTSSHWRNHLLFRNYLRRHPETVAEYAQLKRRLAAQFQFDTERYTDSKAPFISGVLEAARQEFAQLPNDADRNADH